MGIRRSIVACGTVVALTAVAAGCGSSGNGDSSATAASAGPAASGTAAVAEAKKQLAALTAVPQVTKPTEKPTIPAGQKTIGLVTCGNVSAACLRAAKAGQQAASVLGWKAIVMDGKLDPTAAGSAVESLVSRKVDGIVLVAWADKAIPNALKKADSAHIPVVCLFCGNAPGKEGGPGQSDAQVSVDFVAQGRGVGNAIVADSNGKAKVAVATQNLNEAVVQRTKGAKEALQACSTCKIVTTVEESPGGGGNLADVSRKTASGILQRYPGDQITHFVPPSDAEGVGFVQAATAASRDITMYGFDCDEQNLGFIREGKLEKGCMFTPLEWAGWAGVDTLVRLINGDKAVDEGIASYMVTKENITPTGLPKQPAFAAFFTKLWGKA